MFWRRHQGVSPVAEEKPDQLGQLEQVQRDIPTLELEKEQRRKRVQGVVDDSKLMILESCAVGWCKQPISLTCLAGEMQNAGLRGMELMWITVKMVLLCFSSAEARGAMLEKCDLLQWFSSVVP
ncbi:hypothetical protein V6N13_052019 [Hibiscus sabdariffa]|uniref:Uncharacterized protein n=2 Tax=Hibiscus sabdariffa TaxID=183260 RepID=A0ABR1ZHU0_9ROSI